ncbi:MAG: helix-turn-helix domain-containing protein [Bacteroidota bacterium]|nr:helix-turn-helix domain-containing protein [Bacteroidota bacterium]
MNPIRIKNISDFHRLAALPQPEHPLISIIDYSKIKHSVENNQIPVVFSFYSISVKRDLDFKMFYGQQQYDFDEGVMFFMAPGQVLRVQTEANAASIHSGWLLLIHPDFIWNTSLAGKIKKYKFFHYSANESLFLSQKEESIIDGVVKNIQQEYHSNIDKFSQDIIIAQLEVLLNYAERFYQRQFITRRKTNHKILDRLETVLDDYFETDNQIKSRSPSVKYVAEKLNISPDYLSEVLKTLTGENAQQHIHSKLIEKAKQELTTTDLTVSEIAYRLGFEYPQSFSKLFKLKTKQSPLEYRQSFN